MDNFLNVAVNGPSNRQFLQPVWFHAWEKAYGDYQNWKTPIKHVFVNVNCSSQCVLPLGIQQIKLFRFFSLCGLYFPFRGIPYCGDPNDLASEVVSTLKTMHSMTGIRFGPIQHEDPMLVAIVGELECAGAKITKKRIGAEFLLHNPGSGEKFMASLSSKKRYKIKSYWRKLCKNGSTNLHHFNGSEIDWCRVFNDIRGVEALSWVAETGEPKFIGKRNQVFWDIISSDSWFSNALNVWIIYHKEKAASFALTLDSGNTRYAIATGYDKRVENFSSGQILHRHMICDAFDRGIETINFGLGDSGYKSGLGASNESTLIDVVAFLPTLKGTVGYLCSQMKC